jgi:arylsulfatase A-like enzyme
MANISRREFVTDTAALALAATATPSVLAEPGGDVESTNVAGEQPNVLFVLVDQHRIDCSGAYGDPQVHTPNIDALAAEGTRFTNSFCPYPVCTPSRYSLFSGRYVHEHRGWTNHCTLPPEVDTWPGLLRTAGYKTGCAGKMHFTPTYLDIGISQMHLSEQNGPGRWDDDYHRMLRERGLIDANDLEDQEKEFRDHARDVYWDTFGALPSNLPEEVHSTTWIGDRTVEALGGWSGSGNLFVASFIKPHHPFDPPEAWADRYDPDELDVLPGWIEECPEHDLELNKGYFPHETITRDALRRVMVHYYATIAHIDHQVGRMIEVLKRKGLYDNTLIVYTSDHGEYMGCHHMLLKGGYMYDPLIKVPLIVRYPGAANGGTVSDAMVTNLDLAPTILRQCGVEPSAGMHGNDLAQSAGREIVFAESNGGAQVMARTRTRKLLRHDRPNRSFLYDLEKDPSDTDNRYADPAYADDVRALESALAEWRPGPIPETYLNQDAPQIAQPNVPPDLSHRDAIMAYTREKMAEFYTSQKA